MSFLNEVATKLRALTPRRLLETLAAQYNGKPFDEKNARPLLTLFTAEGATFTGFLIDLADDGRGSAIVFKIETQHSAYANELVYLSLDRVTTVVVHGAERFAPILTDGAVARPRDGHGKSLPAPSPLELRRLVASEQERLKGAGGAELQLELERLPATDDARANVLELCRAVVETMVARLESEDPMARDAALAITQIRFRQHDGESPGIRRNGATLSLDVDFTRALPGSLATWVSRQIDANL